jgi:hypothetical protein
MIDSGSTRIPSRGTWTTFRRFPSSSTTRGRRFTADATQHRRGDRSSRPDQFGTLRAAQVPHLGKLLRACGKPGSPLRRVVLSHYVVFLVVVLLTVVPVVFVLETLVSLLSGKRIGEQRSYFAAPSGE